MFMNFRKVKLSGLLSKVFNFTERSINKNDSPETIAGWDSFKALIMIQELEIAANGKFEIEDLKDIRTVEDITRLLDKYKIPYEL